MSRVLLINMPFASLSLPSLALGLFKAQLDDEGIPCDVAYLNVRFAQMVGWDHYSMVERFSAALAGEQMFAHALFGDHIPPDAEYDATILTRLDQEAQRRVQHMRAHVPAFLDNCMRSIPFERYDVVGFSTLFEQNTPCLSLACRIKERFPSIAIVIGGANCEEIMGRTMHEQFPFLDFVCTGEGDVVFPELIKRLAYGHPVDDLPGIVYRDGARSVDNGPPQKIGSLDDLPFPDYDDYFATLKSTGAPASINPQVLVESARGCWWGEKIMCTFCGLNGLGIGFRIKSAERAVAEVMHLVERYDATFVRAVDNMMPPSYFTDFLPLLAAAAPGTELFYEVRPTLDREEIAALAAAGVTNVQAGIENLSTRILKLMQKGTSALKNIEFLKWCKQAGVYVDWNMLFGFPGETAEDYARAHELATAITHLKAPSSIGQIRMDRFSVNYNEAEAMGFTNVRPWSVYRYVYPFAREVLDDLVYFFDHDYREAIDDGGHFDRLVDHVQHWRARESDVMVAERIDGRMVIDDSRPVALARRVVLDGMAAELYDVCDRRRSLRWLQTWLREERAEVVDRAALARLLDDLVARRLMVSEKGNYLSLAMRRGDLDASSRARRAAAAVPAERPRAAAAAAC